MNPAPPVPFSCTYTPNVPELLLQLNCTLLISTYQAGKIIFISPKDKERLVQLPRTFSKAMGVALHEDKMAIATMDEVIILKNAPGLAPNYPRKPKVYDAFFVPRATYYTGRVDIHDLDWGTDGLWAINTSFSSLVKVDEEFSFTPVWQPPFISKLASEDRCHLNGLAMKDGKPKFVTALGSGDSRQSWRENIVKGGVLMDVESSETILQGLAMPHSPRYYKGKLYALLSAIGQLICVDTDKGTYEVVKAMDAFVRGMVIYNDYAFIGTSKLRQNSSTFKDLEIAKKADFAGITIVHLPTASLVGQIRYTNSVDEIYDIQLLPNILRPGILNTATEDHKQSLSLPNATFWARSLDKK